MNIPQILSQYECISGVLNDVQGLSFIKEELAATVTIAFVLSCVPAEVDGDNDAIPQTNPEDSAARTQIHRSKDKGKIMIMLSFLVCFPFSFC